MHRLAQRARLAVTDHTRILFPAAVGTGVFAVFTTTAHFTVMVKRFCPVYVIQTATLNDLASFYPWLDPTGDRKRNWVEQNTVPHVTGYVAKQGDQTLVFVCLIRIPETDAAHAGYWLYSLQVRSRYRGTGLGAALTQRVIDQIQRDGTCWCGGTKWQNRVAMRISVCNWATTEEDVDRSLAAMLTAKRQLG